MGGRPGGGGVGGGEGGGGAGGGEVPGAKEIVKKEGMPVHNFPSDRGDLVANSIIDMPKHLTAEQKAVIAEVF